MRKLSPKATLWLSWFCVAAAYTMVFLVVVMIADHVLVLFKDGFRIGWVVRLHAFERGYEDPFVLFIRKIVPTTFGGRDIGTFLAGVLLYAAFSGFLKLSEKCAVWSAQLKADTERRRLDNVDREKLLEIYAQAKTKLDHMKRSLAFLSIDVVDSTGLKQGEDASVAENDFRQYKHMVEKILAANKSLKATWTPDGLMACFDDAAQAIQAGADVITKLVDFNANVKNMRGEFHVRTGVNAGPVLYDERTPLEEMSDRVIDVAGHMQKHGHPNTVCAPTIIASSYKQFAFVTGKRTIDGFEVSEWAPAPASRPA